MSQKGLVLPILLAIAFFGIAGWFLAYNLPKFIAQITIKPNQLDLPEECSTYGLLEKEQYLTVYIVKQGDTISSIAKSVLGDPSRASEIIELNKMKYDNLFYDSFIEVNWELYLPPKDFPPTSGDIVGYLGRIEGKDKNNVWKLYTQPYNDDYITMPLNVSESTKYLGKDTFAVEECVVMIVDRNHNKYQVISVAPLDYYSPSTPPKQQSKSANLSKYVVQPGDSLLSISKTKLGTTARVNEIRYLNWDVLDREYDKLEVGWTLNLPPSYTYPFTGSLLGYSGKIIKIQGDYWEIQTVKYRLYKDPRAKLFGKESYQQGDCVRVIINVKDFNYDKGSIVAVSPQDEINYFAP